MRYILTPNLEAPYNLIRIGPAYGGQEYVGWTEDEVIAHVIQRNIQVGLIPSDASYWVVDEADLPGGESGPEQEYFFDCWEWDDGCKVNMPKARGIHMDVIRKVRNAELVKEDITFMRAVEAGDTGAQSTIATKKQALRDIPQTFDLTTDTPEQLKAKWPTELPARE